MARGKEDGNSGSGPELGDAELDLLAWLHIAQAVHPDGLLALEVPPSSLGTLERLEALGLVKRGIALEDPRLETWSCTDEGSEVGRKVVEGRAREAQERVGELVARFPRKLLSYWLHFALTPSSVSQDLLTVNLDPLEDPLPLLPSSIRELASPYDLLRLHPLLPIIEGLHSWIMERGLGAIAHDYSWMEVGLSDESLERIRALGMGSLKHRRLLLPQLALEPLKDILGGVSLEGELILLGAFEALRTYLEQGSFYPRQLEDGKVVKVLEDAIEEMKEEGVIAPLEGGGCLKPFSILDGFKYGSYLVRKVLEPLVQGLLREGDPI